MPRTIVQAPALPREFYDRDPALVARGLLGKLLIRRSPEGICAGRIVETEAYLSARDPACHAHRGKTRRNASMFGLPGHAYVYMIHAKWCFNTVTEAEHCGSAVLIRALEPLSGLELMQLRRGTDKLLDLARGPARLCQALDITGQLDGWDLTLRKSLWIADDGHQPAENIAATPRIGISQAAELPLRFCYADSPFVSGRRFKKSKKS
jgi:DNA-3-methyladenine glycosylase